MCDSVAGSSNHMLRGYECRLKQVSGQYFMDCNIAAPATPKTMDMKMAAWLWKYSEELLVAASTVAAIAARSSGGGHVGSSANGEL
jgi:hypothetical protein